MQIVEARKHPVVDRRAHARGLDHEDSGVVVDRQDEASVAVGRDDLASIRDPDPGNAGFTRVAGAVSVAVFEGDPLGVARQVRERRQGAGPVRTAKCEQPKAKHRAGSTR